MFLILKKIIQLVSLEIPVCHCLLSLESAVVVFDSNIYSIENTSSPHKALTKSKHLQCEDFVPFWIEVLVDGMCQQSIIVQFNYTKWVTFTCKRKFGTKYIN